MDVKPHVSFLPTQTAETDRADNDFSQHIVEFGRLGKTYVTRPLLTRCPIPATKRATAACREGDLDSMLGRVPGIITRRVTFLCRVLSKSEHSAVSREILSYH